MRPRIWIVLLLVGCGYRMPAPASSSSPPTAQRPRAVVPLRAPPPISGGTLLVTRDGTALVADPDRDRVWVVELDPLRVAHEIPLHTADEPGRLVEDGGGRVHVVLRRGGALATVEPRSGAIIARRDVCPAPRGLAYDVAHDALHVACAGGELVELPAIGGERRNVRRLEPDLRDVVVVPDGLHVSRFRSAELLQLHDDAVEVTRIPDLEMGAPFTFASDSRQGPYAAAVAWRTIPAPDGGSWMLYQREWKGELAGAPGATYYGGGIVRAGVSYFADGELGRTFTITGGVLPVDIAADASGARLAIVYAGSNEVQVLEPGTEDSESFTMGLARPNGRGISALGAAVAASFTQPVGVAWADDGRVVVQYRDPPAIAVYSHGRRLLTEEFVMLGEPPRRHRGHTIFHDATTAQIACASCHPEGGEDAHTWTISGVGPRRTQTLRGGLLAGAPFHWDGDLGDMNELIELVYRERMGGVHLSGAEVRALGSWLDAIPNVPRSTPRDAEAVERGRDLFVELACDSCHSGARLTDDRSHDVGTGGRFQTPTLIGLATRAPYMHDGSARTLRDRFGPCHTNGHGDLEGIDTRGIDDLVAFMASL